MTEEIAKNRKKNYPKLNERKIVRQRQNFKKLDLMDCSYCCSGAGHTYIRKNW